MKEKNKNSFKSKKGITLIALVVTIVVLLILAAISISMLGGENGIITQAIEAKEETDIAEEKEKVQLAATAAKGKTNWGEITEENLKDELDKNIGEGKYKLEGNILFTITYIDSNRSYIVDKNGNVLETGESPWIGKELQEITGNETKNIITTDSLGNQIVIPAGFKPINTNDNVEDGIIIEDVSAEDDNSKGNQFVWIPIGNIKMKSGNTEEIILGRYEYGNNGEISQYSGMDEEWVMDYGMGKNKNIARDIEKFISSANNMHGYYLARFEAGDQTAEESVGRNEESSTNVKPVSKKGKQVYNFILQEEAATLGRNMYNNSNYVTDLVNSYSWDTAIQFIQKCSNVDAYEYSIQSGTNTKKIIQKTGESILESTGKEDMVCNIYDMAGNVLERSTETNRIIPCVSRGGKFDGGSTSNRSNMSNNKFEYQAFRCILYINEYIEKDNVESKLAEVTGNEKNNTTTTDVYGNKIIIPAGFKVINPESSVTEGIIIEDVSANDDVSKGNQFIWIPVGEIDTGKDTVKINLGRYRSRERQLGEDYENYTHFNGGSYDYVELDKSSYGNVTAKSLKDFIERTLNNGGFYIARYEAGDQLAESERTSESGTNGRAIFKEGKYVYDNVKQSEAANLARKVYDNENFKSDLVNSYAWDTTLAFINAFDETIDNYMSLDGKSGISTEKPQLTGKNKLAITGNEDVQLNIYDIAGNVCEWTTETVTSTNTPNVERGGSYSFGYPSYRSWSNSRYPSSRTGFRAILYLL